MKLPNLITKSLLAAGLFAAGASAPAQPANDQFANRIGVTGTNFIVQGTTVGSVPDPAEPYQRTVWWEWTAPTDGEVMITRRQGEYRYDCTVFIGTNLPGLQPVASLDYNHLLATTFSVEAGVKYQLAVGSWYQLPVGLNLQLIPHPPHQSFASRISLGTGDIQVHGTLGSFTNGFPDSIEGTMYGLVWYSWTAATSGPISLKLEVEPGMSASPRNWVSLSVFTGDQEDQLSTVVRSDTGAAYGQHYGAEVTFTAQAGTTYQIAVSGKPFPGAFDLSVLRSAAPEVMLVNPPLDSTFHLGDTIPLRALAFDPEGHAESVDFFWVWSATPHMPDIVGYYEQIASVTNWPFTADWKPETPGRFELLARAEDGLGARRCSPTVAINVRPSNDDFASRISLTGASLTTTGYCGNASRQPGEPQEAGQATAWWSWTAPQTGPVTITIEPSYNLAVFSGDDLSNLVLVTNGAARVVFSATAGTAYQIAVALDPTADPSAAIYGEGRVELTFTPSLPPSVTITSPAYYTTVVLGTNFEVTVAVVPGGAAIQRVEFYTDGDLLGVAANAPFSFTVTNAGATWWGSYHLKACVIDANGLDAWSEEVVVLADPAPPSNDNFADRIVLTGASVTATGNVAYATSESGEPPPGLSAWWSWSAPASGAYTVTDAGLSGTLSIFTGNSVTNLTLVAVGTNMNGLRRAVIQAVAGTSYALDVSGGGVAQISIVPSLPPKVRFLQPTNTLDVISGQPIHLAAEATDADGVVTNVDFYLWTSEAGYRWLGAATNVPYAINVSLETTNWLSGSLWADATDNAGLRTSSDGAGITVHPPPAANDNFADRIELSGVSLVATGTTAYATREPGEPNYNQQSAWWAWTAPTSGPATIAFTQGEAGTYLTVYAGDSLTNLTQVAQWVNRDGGLPGWLTFNAQAGTNYKIAVSSWGSAVAFRLAMSQPPTVALLSPTNLAVVLFGGSVMLEAGASDPEGALSRVDFYIDGTRVGTATNAPYRFEFRPKWFHYTYGLVAVATDDQGLSTRSAEVTFTVEPPPAPNDDFAHRVPLSGFMVRAGWENPHFTDGVAWWTWTAPASGTVTIRGRDLGYGKISIYSGTGPEVTDLTLVREGSNPGFTFEAVAGTIYQIAAEHLMSTSFMPLFYLALDNPQAALIDQIGWSAGGELLLHVTTLSQQPWWLQASTNLVDWQTISTNASGNQVFEFADPEGRAYPARFYRLLGGDHSE